MAKNTHEALREHIDNIWLVDTHEHLDSEAKWLEADEGLVDFSRFFACYASVDMISAGMPQSEMDEMRKAETPLDKKWALIEPYWDRARNTTYCKAVDEAIRDLFDLPGLSKDTYKPLAKRMRKMRKPGYYRQLLKDRARIEISVLDTDDEEAEKADREFFAPVCRFDQVILVHNREQIAGIERDSGMSIHSLDDLTSALAALFERKRQAGIVGVKSGLAYLRTLYYENPAKTDAERAFSRMFASPGYDQNAFYNDIPSGECKVLQDYLFHKVVQLCVEHDLPMQIHTGIQDGNGNYLRQSNPALLTDIFMTYPRARFDVFHAGYPYWRELGVLAKMFPSVHADMCWTHIIYSAARNALDEWLELMPASKIFAFGGDYIFVEGAYAHAKIARRNVTEVLAGKVDSGYFTLDEAKHIADMILRENAKEFFRLEV